MSSNNILGNMNHLKVHHEFGIFVFEGLVAVGGRNEDFLYTIINKVLMFSLANF